MTPFWRSEMNWEEARNLSVWEKWKNRDRLCREPFIGPFAVSYGAIRPDREKWLGKVLRRMEIKFHCWLSYHEPTYNGLRCATCWHGETGLRVEFNEAVCNMENLRRKNN